MFRLVQFREDAPSDKPIVEYLSSIVSRTILDAFGYLLQTEGDYQFYYESFVDDNFFAGIGEYFHTTYVKAGYEIFRRKIERMKEKLRDPKEYYTFDLLEERIFYYFICEMKFQYEMEEMAQSDYCFIDSKKEKTVAVDMISKFDIEPEFAALLVKESCRFHEMALDDGYDENLVFWDDDYLWFFENGFIEGVKHMLAAEGEMFGYGYKYVVELFEDINLKAPMLLIGTESAHQMVNKMAMERYNELMNKMFDGANAAENSWNPDDDNLPFS